MKQHKAAMAALHWVLGLVVLTQSLWLALAPGRIHAFGKTGMPDAVRLLLAWSEALAAVLFLIPPSAVAGGYVLVFIFAAAAVLHVLHGMYDVSGLVLYAAATIAVITYQRERA